MKKNKSNKNTISIMIIFVMLISVTAISYSLFKFKQEDKKLNEVKTGTLNIEYDDKNGSSISMKDTYPMTLEEGENTEPYKFKITNTGSINSSYVIKLVNDEEVIKKDNCKDNQLTDNLIRYSFNKNNNETLGLLSDTNNWILDTGEIKTKESKSYELKLWLDYNATNDAIGKHFHVKVLVEANQSIK